MSHRDGNDCDDYDDKKIVSTTSKPSVDSAMATELHEMLQRSGSEDDVSVDKSQLNCLIYRH